MPLMTEPAAPEGNHVVYDDDPRTLPLLQRHLYPFLTLNAVIWALVYYFTHKIAPVGAVIQLMLGEALCAYALVFWAVLRTTFTPKRKVALLAIAVPATWAVQMGVAALLKLLFPAVQ